MRLTIRILLSPLIFLWGFFLLFTLTMFPIIPMIVLFIGIFGLLSMPFIWLLRKGGSDIEYIEPFIDEIDNIFLSYLATITVYFWFPLYYTYYYIKTGKFIK